LGGDAIGPTQTNVVLVPTPLPRGLFRQGSVTGF